MISHDVLLLINAIICTGIAARVLLFRREGARHRRWGGWLAYLVIVASASIPVCTYYGFYSVNWPQLILNAVFLAAILKTKGNVVQIFKISRSQHGH